MRLQYQDPKSMKQLWFDANSICLPRKMYWKIFQEKKQFETALKGALYQPRK